ncbi:MAG TPA: DUF5683 domain-containing protein [Chitinophagales bacterium]|nr:DUF5683 domain-containing protein [Chitinophagales bacterium]
MSVIRCTIYDVRCTILKFTVLLFFFITYSALSAQDSTSNRDAIEKSIKIDSLYLSNGTSEISSEKLIDDSLNTVAINKKIKKQKKVDTTHYSPKKAAIWAAACPGLGQIYMKKYWKLPIVYGILSTTLYFVVSNSLKLKEFNGYIRNIYDSVPNPEPYTDLPLTQIETFRNSYRRNVQLASFGTLFAWGLSIVDAVVDAHLHSFDISDKLTMKIKPELNYSNFTYYTGIGVHLNFK